MKSRLLLLGLGLLGASAMQAQTSPWAGNVLPEDGGTFYLYQVETGKWLQNNNRIAEYWTTRAEVDKFGFDVEIIKLADGGYQLNPKFGHNNSINGSDDQFYLDTGRPVTKWNLQPTTVAGVSNTYKIFTDDEHFMNVNDEGNLDDFGWNENWQLVTREERLADLMTATKASPKDATWLIGAHDFANQDQRFEQWHRQFEGGNNVTGGDGIVRANRAFESWNSTRIIDFSQTLTGIPNGTYQLRVQGFYRDGHESEIGNKYVAGEEVIRASYFANDVTHPFMSICQSGVTEEDLDAYAVPQGGVYIPGNTVPGNALDRASNCFFKGGYWNEPITVVVSNGTLKIGVIKDGFVEDDWTVFDNFELTYLGNEIDLSEVLANLATAITEAEAYDGEKTALLSNALAAAKDAQSSTNATTIQDAVVALREALLATKEYNVALANAEAFKDGVITSFFSKALEAGRAARTEATTLDALRNATQSLINALNDVRNAQEPLKFVEQTIPFAQEVGVSDDIIARAQAVLTEAESVGAINDALNQLRVARKIQVADKHEDVFAGATPADGNFYVYNVGLKRFLCGGGDWGAHAYVGFPGVEITLISGTEFPENGDAFSGFKFDTHLNNGGDSEYLGYNGYMDTPAQALWEFIPVEGKTGVYAIARANGEKNEETGERMLLGYRPGTYGNIDTDMYGVNDVNNEWKLVTKAERDALLATATVDKPQDASYKIQSPGFNQREDISAWVSQYSTGTVWERGSNHTDFAFECWNAAEFDFSQTLYDVLPGWYKISVQGYYRDGDHANQIRTEAAGEERVRAAKLVNMNNFEEVALPNILDEVNQAPGLGNRSTARFLVPETDEEGNPLYNDDGTPRMKEDPNGENLYVGEFPMWITEACEYFQNGLYKTDFLIEATGQELMILVQKMREKNSDWVVLDNFRLTYFGTEKPSEDNLGISEMTATTGKAPAAIYNLQGQQLKNATKGIVIRDGKKIFMK